MIDDDECGAVGGMRIGRGNRSTRKKPAPVSLCPPQIPHDLTWDISHIVRAFRPCISQENAQCIQPSLQDKGCRVCDALQVRLP
jgi:hypothetical protein